MRQLLRGGKKVRDEILIPGPVCLMEESTAATARTPSGQGAPPEGRLVGGVGLRGSTRGSARQEK